jgi:hypothetical protein
LTGDAEDSSSPPDLEFVRDMVGSRVGEGRTGCHDSLSCEGGPLVINTFPTSSILGTDRRPIEVSLLS